MDAALRAELDRAPSFRSVRAVAGVVLRTDLEWTTRRGEVLHGRAGDLLCSDGESFWTVAAQVVTERFEQEENGRWRRSTPVRAVCVGTGCLVATLEGRVTAEPGDWILDGGPLGDGRHELWVVDGPRFGHVYEPFGDAEAGGPSATAVADA